VTALLLKDLKVGTLFLWLIGLIYLPIMVQFVVFGHDAPMLLASVALAASLVASVLAVEWRVDADRFLCSLPVSRSSIVRARCLSILAAGAVSLVLWMCGGLIGNVLVGDAGRGTPLWATFEGLMGFCLTIVGLAALFMPCHFGFGIGKGSAVFAFLLIPLIGAETAGSLIVLPGVAGSEGVPSSVPILPGSLAWHVIGQAHQGLGTIGALALFSLAGAVMLWASVALSVKFYEKREL
jgi:ABC-2 family transporter protein